MCHLFSVVSSYALPLLRRPVPRDLWDQRETGDPSATCWLASHQQIISYKGMGVMGWGQRSAYMVVKAPVSQRWERPDDGTCGEGTFKQTEEEGWDCWVSHSRILGIDIKSMGSAWSCGFLSFWARISTSWRSGWVYGICNRFIFSGLKILCKALVLFSIPNSWALVWREWMCYPTVKISKQVERTREGRKGGWRVWF